MNKKIEQIIHTIKHLKKHIKQEYKAEILDALSAIYRKLYIFYPDAFKKNNFKKIKYNGHFKTT